MDEIEFVEGKVNWKGKPATKDKHGGSRAALFVLVTNACENMATFALAVNLVTYFNRVMHYNLADAATHLTNFMGTSYILSIAIAYLADSYLGRFKAAIISLFIEFLGLAILTIQAHHPKLKPPVCNIFDPTAHCEVVKGGNSVMLFTGLYALAVGAAGLKASLSAHGADQFDEKDPKEAKQMSSYFNWILLGICTGGAVSLTLIVWAQDNEGWDWGFAISTFSMVLGIVVFTVGLPRYRIHVVKGNSAFAEIIQVYVAAFRNRKLELPEDASELYEINFDKEAAQRVEFLPHRQVFKFLDKAAIQTSQEIDNPSENQNPWKLCRVTQVENAKIILGMVPIFICSIAMTLCLAQLQTFTIQQGVTMDTRIANSAHIPPASIPIFPVIFLIILLPLYDKFFVQFARKFTGIPTGITHLQRVGVGLVLSSVSMAAAGIMEVKRKAVARDHNMLDALPIRQPLPISVFWLSIQYFIFGIADMFTFVGLLEFFYSQAPKGLKSMSTCFLWGSMAVGYFVSTIVVEIVNAVTKNVTRSRGWLAGNNINRNHLNLFYWLLSALSVINFLIYLFVSKRYEYRPQSPEVDEDNRSMVHAQGNMMVEEENSAVHDL